MKNYESCTQISDDGLKDLTTYLGKLSKSLLYLSLNFAKYSLRRKKPDVNFEFFSCGQISGSGMEELCEKVANKLKYLQHLSLNICS